mgnify:CR=1 FL=1
MLPDGTRRSDPMYHGGASRLISMSVGNADFQRAMVERWLATRTPDKPWIDCSENDTTGKCMCEDCMALDEPDPPLDFPWEEREARARAAFAAGWSRLKLYFMVGLPFETEEDVAGIPALINKVLEVAADQLDRSGYGRLKLRVSVNSFVPKPHTPFQWLGHDSSDSLNRKRDLIRRGINNRRVSLSFNNARQSVVEAALARGDRRHGAAILSAYRAGALFDSWTEHFKFDLWRDAFAEHGLDVIAEATRDIPTDARLPWDVIDSGVDRRFLLAELDRAREGTLTPDCREADCQSCGMARLVPDCPLTAGRSRSSEAV